MSNPYVDAIIFILLFVSVGFSGIGIFGLVLFPDIRSRLHTAVRATTIGTAAMVLSVTAYAFFAFLSGGGDGYSFLLLHTLVLMGIVAVANWVLYHTIRTRARTTLSCQEPVPAESDLTKTK